MFFVVVPKLKHLSHSVFYFTTFAPTAIFLFCILLSEISFVQELLGVPKPPQEVTQTGEVLEAPLSDGGLSSEVANK